MRHMYNARKSDLHHEYNLCWVKPVQLICFQCEHKQNEEDYKAAAGVRQRNAIFNVSTYFVYSKTDRTAGTLRLYAIQMSLVSDAVGWTTNR